MAVVFGSLLDHGGRSPLELYESGGIEGLTARAGDFAVVVWDGARDRLLLARNHAGTRPLYYAEAGDRIAFGADVASVQALAGGAVDVNEVALANFLSRLPPPVGETMLAAVRSVPPAHVVECRPGGAAARRYWDPRSCPPLAVASVEEAAEELRPLLRRVVGERAGAAALGMHLSGGIDSAAVATHAVQSRAERSFSPPAAYAWQRYGTGEGHVDQAMIRACADALGVDVRYVPFTAERFRDWLALDPLREPVASTLAHELAVMGEAARDGVDVVLSGWGGDELVSSSGVPRRSALRRRAAALRRRLAVGSRDLPARGFGNSALRELAGDPRSAQPRPASTREAQIGRLELGHLAARADGWSVFGARHGIQYGFPLLDRRILEFTLGLPESVFPAHRGLMREALRGLIPEAVRTNRDKTEPSRYRDLVAALEAFVRDTGTDLTVDPARARHLDLPRLAANLSGAGPIQQPGKFMAALQFAFDAGGVPLRSLMAAG